MRDNRPFSSQEDNLIRDLYEQQNIKKWSIIAKLLTEQHNLPRNAKQCRDRYHQALDPMMLSEWSRKDEELLYAYHNEIGNKWAVIAQKFPGRTDNCVKNHFYSKLRKSLRHLNKVIKSNFKKEFKQLKIGAIYKIIEALEDRFSENTTIENQVFSKCIRLKKQLLQYAEKDNSQPVGDYSNQRELILQIIDFSRNYKRKTKKQRRSSFNGELFKPSTIQKRIKYSSDQESSESEYSFVVSHREQSDDDGSNESEVKLGVIEEDIRQSMSSKYEPNLRLTNKSRVDVDVEQDPIRNSVKNSLRGSYKSNFDNVEKILRGKNVLEEGIFFSHKHEASLCSSSHHSESERHDMFDDNIRISEGLRNVEEMDEESPEENIFLSQR